MSPGEPRVLQADAVSKTAEEEESGAAGAIKDKFPCNYFDVFWSSELNVFEFMYLGET